MTIGGGLIFDLDEAAQAAYEQYREDAGATRSWLELCDEERAVWHRATAAALETYDPETFGVAVRSLVRFWGMIEPIAKPYISLIFRPVK